MAGHFERLPIGIQKELSCIAKRMVAPGKGILAADEGPDTMEARFKEINVKNTEENRRQWRQVLFSTSPEMSKYISGIILSEETLHHCNDDGCLFIDVLKKNGILYGVCADKGLVKMWNTVEGGETATQGLDDLVARCENYRTHGCTFAKWRAAYKIGQNIPSYSGIIENANALARYAAVCQSKRLVPIVEPDISIEGDYDLSRGEMVAQTVLAFVYKALSDHHVYLEGTVLKASMVTAGDKCSKEYTSKDFAQATVLTMFRYVPPAVPGVAFLSGGQTDEQSTKNLNAINKVTKCKPWMLTFCFGRALQGAALRSWAGCKANTAKAQEIFLERCKSNAVASQGKVDDDAPNGYYPEQKGYADKSKPKELIKHACNYCAELGKNDGKCPLEMSIKSPAANENRCGEVKKAQPSCCNNDKKKKC